MKKLLMVLITLAIISSLAACGIGREVGGSSRSTEPEQPYTDEDLNYNDRNTRATMEQNDPDARPAIQGSITDFEQYDVVYVGYPIWLTYYNLIQCTRA